MEETTWGVLPQAEKEGQCTCLIPLSRGLAVMQSQGGNSHTHYHNCLDWRGLTSPCLPGRETEGVGKLLREVAQ